MSAQTKRKADYAAVRCLPILEGVARRTGRVLDEMFQLDPSLVAKIMTADQREMLLDTLTVCRDVVKLLGGRLPAVGGYDGSLVIKQASEVQRLLGTPFERQWAGLVVLMRGGISLMMEENISGPGGDKRHPKEIRRRLGSLRVTYQKLVHRLSAALISIGIRDERHTVEREGARG